MRVIKLIENKNIATNKDKSPLGRPIDKAEAKLCSDSTVYVEQNRPSDKAIDIKLS